MNLFEYMQDEFIICFDVKLSDRCRGLVEKWINQYGGEEVEEAINIACEKYDNPTTAIGKIGGILYNRERLRRKYFEDEV